MYILDTVPLFKTLIVPFLCKIMTGLYSETALITSNSNLCHQSQCLVQNSSLPLFLVSFLECIYISLVKNMLNIFLKNINEN